MKNYKEDSTRGKSMIRPRNYKGDTLVQVWVDRRKLAMLSVWVDEGGYNTRYMSEVLRYTIDEVVENLIENKIVEKIEFTQDATAILSMKYRTDLNPSGKGLKNLQHNLVLDELRKGSTFVNEIGQRPQDGEIVQKVKEQTNEALKIYKELEKSGRWKVNEDTNEYDEDGVVIRHSAKPAKEGAVDVEEALKRAREVDDALDDM